MNYASLVSQRIAEATGLPAEDLDADALLEADLGVDSLKMIGLWNNLLALLPRDRIDPAAADFQPETLSRFQTLGEIIDFFVDALREAGGGAQQPAHQARQSAPAVADAAPGRGFPMANAQWLFLIAHQMIDSTSLCSAVRVHGVPDISRMERCWQSLVQRHVNLRTVFFIPPDARNFSEFSYRLLDAPKVPAIERIDLSSLPGPGQEAALEKEFTRLLNLQWNLTQWPLHRFSVARLADDEHVIFLSNEHIISDGLSNQLLMREFLALYAADADGAALGIPLDEPGYDAVVAKMNGYRSAAESEAFDRWSKDVGRAVYKWNPDRLKVTSPSPQFINRKRTLPRGTTAKLLALTEQWRVSLYALLMSAYLYVVAEFDPDGDSPLIQVPTSGNLYPDADVSGVAGCFAQAMALRFPRPMEDAAAYARAVHAENELALSNGYDREATRRMAETIGKDFVLQSARVPNYVLAQMRSNLKSNLYFPFTGHTHIERRYAELEVTDYRAGTSNVVGTVDILQEIHDACLHVFANYDRQALSDATAERMLDAYLARLSALADMASPDAAACVQPPLPALDPAFVDGVLGVANGVLAHAVGASSLHDDLEAKLGVDSLERVRLCTRLGQQWNVSPRELLGCRSLAEFAARGEALLARAAPPADASAAVKRPSDASAPRIVVLDESLAHIPYLHIIAQAQRTPDAPAVTRGDTVLSYRELDRASNRLGHYLRQQGIGRGDLVALAADRGPNMLIAILGILKAGGAYVPIDPDYPLVRMRYIVEHARVKQVLYEAGAFEDADTLAALVAGVQATALDRPPQSTNAIADWRQCVDTPLAQISQPDDLMVVLYTSGSTGKPKGVALGHRGYMNRLAWHHKVFQLAVGERVAQKTSCSFDISVWELLWPLMVGGTVCTVGRETVRDPWAFSEWLVRERIAVAHFVPSMFTEFVNAHQGQTLSLPDLRWLIFSGEALPVSTIHDWIDRQGLGIGLANLYGPTEASIDVSCHIVSARPDDEATRIPIGAPIDNAYLVIVGDDGSALPDGEMGELCIAGLQLAHGYLHDPEKTATAFVPNCIAGMPGSMLYRTGDMAVRMPDGQFDYRGRIDSQIKIRGFRVELGEIEAVLCQHPQVVEAAVLALPVKEQLKLVAWYVSDEADDQSVRDWLHAHLTDYMVPHLYLKATGLPKSHNGKLDRGELARRFQAHFSSTAEKVTALPSEDELPLAPAQKWLVSYYDDPYRWWGYTRVRYHGVLNIDAFTEALNRLIGAHPALCTVFKRGHQGWRRHINAAPPRFEPKFFDGRGHDDHRRESLLRKQIEAAADALRIDAWPLIDVIVVWLGKDHFEFCIIAHHMIGDLIAGNVMFRTMWKTYEAVLAGNAAPAAPVPGSERLVRALMEKDASGESRAYLDYWLKEFPDPASGFHLDYDHVLGENLESSSASVRLELARAETQTLLSQTKEFFSGSLYHVLTVPLYQLLAQRTGRSRVVVSHRVNGRDALPREVFFDSVDNFAVNYPLALQVSPQESPAALATRLKAAMEKVPLKGVSYDWMSERLPSYMYPDHRLTPVRANYLGNLSMPSSTTFEVRAEDNNQRLAPAGQKRSAMIEVWFSVLDGCFRMEIGYSTNFFKKETIAALAEDYLARLRGMIAASLAQPKPQPIHTVLETLA